MNVRRLSFTLSVTMASVATAVLLGAGAAAAPSSPGAALEVSVDGEHFAAAVPDSILDERAVLVPGDRLSGAVWVRNAGTALGWMRVTVAAPAVGHPEYLRTLDIAVGQTQTAGLLEVDACTELVPVQAVPAGEVVRVPVVVRFADVAGTTAQGRSASVALRVSMGDSPTAFGACGAEPPGTDTTAPPATDVTEPAAVGTGEPAATDAVQRPVADGSALPATDGMEPGETAGPDGAITAVAPLAAFALLALVAAAAAGAWLRIHAERRGRP